MTEPARSEGPWRAVEIDCVWFVVRDGEWQAHVRVTPSDGIAKIDETCEHRAHRIAKILNALAG